MRVLIVGGGAREHALVRAFKRSPGVRSILVAPGNGGIANEVRCEAVRADDVLGLQDLALREGIELCVIGPEAPLVAGLSDRLRNAGIAVFGPGAMGARLEGSKFFAKNFMKRYGIPTADFRAFDDADAAAHHIRVSERPLVVKADGLAAGKGVVVAANAKEAFDAIDWIMRDRVFGDAGNRVVIEEQLRGPEVSLHVLTDGRDFSVLGAAQDHKRVGEGDTGPNTGGMGAYAPVKDLPQPLLDRCIQTIVRPTLKGLNHEGISFRGVLFFGLMIQDGVPMLLEFNTRFGDPEGAVLLARVNGDIVPTIDAVAHGRLNTAPALQFAEAALAVVLAADGYPTAPRQGMKIEGIAEAQEIPGVAVLHAGTKRTDTGEFTVAGGRVLTVTAKGNSVDEAAERAYAATRLIRFEGMHYRRDIGWRVRTQVAS